MIFFVEFNVNNSVTQPAPNAHLAQLRRFLSLFFFFNVYLFLRIQRGLCAESSEPDAAGPELLNSEIMAQTQPTEPFGDPPRFLSKISLEPE